jgi:hypothetical protein
MSAALGLIRGLALVGVALSVLAVPLGVLLLATSLPQDRGDNQLGDVIAVGIGSFLLVLGGAGLILGGGLAVLARRALAAPAEIRGSRRTALVAGLAVAGGEVLISSVLAGAAQMSPSAALSFFVGLLALFAAPFVIVASATGRRAECVVAGVLAVALLTLGAVILLAQAWLMAQPPL